MTLSCSWARPLMALTIAGAAALTILINASTSAAESYVGGMIGATLPMSLTNVEQFSSITGTSTNLSLQNSVMYGVKLGHYFDSDSRYIPKRIQDLFPGKSWLGVETELFNTTPNIKQQFQAVTLPNGTKLQGNVEGESLRVFTWAFNIVARYPGERWQPYVALGLGIFFAHTHDGLFNESQSSNWTPGLNTQVGIRYIITKQLAAFGEWKFNHARFDFDPGVNIAGLRGDYNVHMLAVGLSYHF